MAMASYWYVVIYLLVTTCVPPVYSALSHVYAPWLEQQLGELVGVS